MDLPPPYWAFAWAGGQALARYLLDNPAMVAGRRVLDLARARASSPSRRRRPGAAPVLAADIDAFAEAAIAPQRGGQRRRRGDDRRRPARRAPRAAIRRRAGRRPVLRARRWPSARWPSLEAARARGAQVLVGDPAPQLSSRRTASASSPSIRCRSRASWRTPRSSAPRYGVSIPCVADPTRAFPIQMESPRTFRTHRCRPDTCCRDPSRCSLRCFRRAGSRCQAPG